MVSLRCARPVFTSATRANAHQTTFASHSVQLPELFTSATRLSQLQPCTAPGALGSSEHGVGCDETRQSAEPDAESVCGGSGEPVGVESRGYGYPCLPACIGPVTARQGSA